MTACLGTLLCLFAARTASASSIQLTTTADPPPNRLSTVVLPPNFLVWSGETFTVPAAPTNVLTSFGFYAFNDAVTRWTLAGTFRAEIWEWTGTGITGSALYSSAVFSTPPPTGWLDFNTGGLALTPNGTYIALLETLTNTTGGRIFGGGSVVNSYSGGALWSTEVTTGPLVLSPSSHWFTPASAPNADLALRATFETPEPASLVLLGTGVIGIGMVRRRRRRT